MKTKITTSFQHLLILACLAIAPCMACGAAPADPQGSIDEPSTNTTTSTAEGDAGPATARDAAPAEPDPAPPPGPDTTPPGDPSTGDGPSHHGVRAS
jgi:hypothetical protein